MEASEIIQAMHIFNTVYQFLKEIREILDKSETGRWKLPSLRKTDVEKKFKEALIVSKNAISSCIWFGKGFAIGEECGSKVDKEFHHLMGLLISQFNEIYMKLDPKKLDKRLIEHLISQLKILENYAQRFYNIQNIRTHPDKEKDAMKIIGDFRSRLWDFKKSMEPYLKPET